MADPRIQYAKTSDGVNIAYYTLGEGTPYIWPSTPLGGGLNNQWQIPELRAMLEGIAQRFMLVTMDPRGFGLSDRGSMDFTCEAFVKDLEAVADATRSERFILQSFSYMTMPALLFAAEHADRLQALVLLNGVMRGSDMSKRWLRLVQLARDDWEYAKMLLARTNEAAFSSTATLEQSEKALDAAATRDAYLALSEGLATWDLSEAAASILTPTLVIHYGDRTPYIPMDASRRLAAALSNGSFVSISRGTGEEPVVEAVSRSVIRFLRETAPDSVGQASRSAMPGTAIILFADIADSTALTERLGDAAFRDKARELDESLRRAIASNGGTAIDGKLLGDGVLATFGAAREAIACASAIQDAGSRVGLPLHVGIHAGDVIREANNVYGGAVNIAARICAISAPGEILVSDVVRGMARSSAGVEFADYGEQEMKGVGEPVRVYVVRHTEDRP